MVPARNPPGPDGGLEARALLGQCDRYFLLTGPSTNAFLAIPPRARAREFIAWFLSETLRAPTGGMEARALLGLCACRL
jgi:hypothetical protein